MEPGGTSNKNKEMVVRLQQDGIIKSEKVAQVMESIDKGLFLLAGGPASAVSPATKGFIAASNIAGYCLELLREHLQPGMSVLDVGSGTGYLTACFAMMVGPEGSVVGVEHIPELADLSIENIKKTTASPLLDGGSLSVRVADGRQGCPELEPYDAIHVGAAASEIPQPLIDQLKLGGRLVIPVGTTTPQTLQVVDKKMDGSISITIQDDIEVVFVPLTSKEAQ